MSNANKRNQIKKRKKIKICMIEFNNIQRQRNKEKSIGFGIPNNFNTIFQNDISSCNVKGKKTARACGSIVYKYISKYDFNKLGIVAHRMFFFPECTVVL